MKKSRTRDELFLVKLEEMALLQKDPYAEVDRYAVGKAMGQGDRSVDNIVRMLAQTNFIKKGEGNAVYLTPHGLTLVHSLR